MRATGGAASTAPSPAPAAGAGPARDASLALTRALHHQLRRAGRGAALFVYDVTSQRPVLAVRADRLLKTLVDGGAATARLASREGTPELWLADPDGIKIQLQHAAYGHGSGRNGEARRR